jgi:hypothetical protein
LIQAIDHYDSIYFARIYDFAPPSTSSILVHRGRNNDSVFILVTQKSSSIKRLEGGVVSDGSWMFDPTIDESIRI